MKFEVEAIVLEIMGETRSKLAIAETADQRDLKIERIKNRFQFLKKKLNYFRSEMLKLERKANLVYSIFSEDSKIIFKENEENMAKEIGGFNIFSEVFNKIQTRLKNLKNLYRIKMKAELQVFGANNNPESLQIREESQNSKETKGTAALLAELRVEDLFELFNGSLVSIQDLVINKCLLYHVFEEAKLIKLLIQFRNIFLGANGLWAHQLTSFIFKKDGYFKRTGMLNFGSYLFDIIYENINQSIFREKQNYQKIRSGETEEERNTAKSTLKARLNRLDGKKWLKVSFDVGVDKLQNGPRFLDMMGCDLIRPVPGFLGFKKIFFTEEIVALYVNIFFEILKVSHCRVLKYRGFDHVRGSLGIYIC